jgi:hypothetical protein
MIRVIDADGCVLMVNITGAPSFTDDDDNDDVVDDDDDAVAVVDARAIANSADDIVTD